MRQPERTERTIKREILNPDKVSIERVYGKGCGYNVFENEKNIAIGAKRIEIVLEAGEPCRIEILSE